MELPTRENLSAVLKEMTKAMVDVILKEELSEFLGYDKYEYLQSSLMQALELKFVSTT